ncbi:MAG: homocysteine S-methyltransferase family protein [Elusimicrobiales bacterium]|nr:homocysteine S-methyltransferase family protein [Elusimicrobiales bacterium]
MNTKDFNRIMAERIVIMDGSMGIQLSRLGLRAEDFGGAQYEGCNDYLCLVNPKVVAAVHESYLKAGADVVETCTLNASSVALAEYGLQRKAREINKAAAQLARAEADKFSTADKPRFVAGSVGPTTKSLSVTGGITFAELHAAYIEQMLGLADGGTDFYIIETAPDLLNIKAAVEAALETAQKAGRDIPVIVSATFGTDGKMLSGQDAEAFCVSFAHYPLLALGMNCSTGPGEMAENLRIISGLSKFPVICMPNAGLPDEQGAYKLSARDFGEKMSEFARAGYLNLAGGCCGTNPSHIAELVSALKAVKPRIAAPKKRFAVCGLEAVFSDEAKPPLLVGERANVIGSREFKNLISAEKWDEAAAVARRQARGGAHVIDICLSNPEREEIADIKTLVPLITRAVRAPLMIDTTNPAAAETALALMPGKSIWNSINLESGPEKLLAGARLNRKYGCALVIGCIDESGKDSMAVTRGRKLEIAKRAFSLLKEAGVPEEDMIFDALVFPAASGQEKYRGAALETVKAVELFKKEFPLSESVLGVSNVSFGLPPAAREALNSILLHHAVRAGLGMAIVNVEKLRRYPSLSDEERSLGEKLLFSPDADTAALFAAMYRDKTAKSAAKPATPREKLRAAVINGSPEGVPEAAGALAREMSPAEIINGPLSEGMAEVGKLFSRGELIVTEVLQSAETMKLAVAALEPYLAKDRPAPRGKLLLATVRGDVHDIGKNLVRMIFESNGFAVEDLGVKVSNQAIIEAARRVKPDIIGLSGLLTKSAEAMITVAADLSADGIDTPLLAGGAALSEKFVSLRLAPAYKGRVYFARDAMSGLASALELVRAKA